MIIAVPRDSHPGEKRVAMTPAVAAQLVRDGHEVRIERGAGNAAGYTDAEYESKGAKLSDNAQAAIDGAHIILQVHADKLDAQLLSAGQLVIGFADPLVNHDALRRLSDRRVTLFAMELIPRITRAQAMDALSSQANLAGYKAVIRAAEISGHVFPMMMTAAGTLQPAKVFVIGAGVAGLQAIATAKRLGAVVSAYDVRPVVKEQVQSLGAKFVELPIETTNAEDQGGYAREQTPEQIAKQQELMARTIAESDIVITTALIPGKPAPKLITAAMVEGMQAGSVIIDLAAERGGNCELTRQGETYQHNGVTIVGDDQLIAGVANAASQMYANNLAKLLKHLAPKGELNIDTNDQITAGALVMRDGEIVNPQVRESMKL